MPACQARTNVEFGVARNLATPEPSPGRMGRGIVLPRFAVGGGAQFAATSTEMRKHVEGGVPVGYGRARQLQATSQSEAMRLAKSLCWPTDRRPI